VTRGRVPSRRLVSVPGACGLKGGQRLSEVFLHLAADALEWCGASRAEPLALEGLRERFLPGCGFRGRQNAKLQYAVLAAAAVHGGTEQDSLEEIA
jgi:hypothetical protein